MRHNLGHILDFDQRGTQPKPRSSTCCSYMHSWSGQNVHSLAQELLVSVTLQFVLLDVH